MVPLKGGIGGIVHPPIGRFFTTYIPHIVLAEPGELYATYHLLGEPETTIDLLLHRSLSQLKRTSSRWWVFQIFLEFSPLLGEDVHPF